MKYSKYLISFTFLIIIQSMGCVRNDNEKSIESGEYKEEKEVNQVTGEVFVIDTAKQNQININK